MVKNIIKKEDIMMKRYVMECIGTFFLTIAISLIANPIAIGLMLMAMIYVGGHISGGHFNPAISFVSFLQNRLKASDLGMYMVAQSVGAALALCLSMMMTNSGYSLDIFPGSPIVVPMAIEALLVLVFAWVYLSMNMMARYHDSVLPGIVVGLTLLAIASGPGGLFNPAVAVGSMVCELIKEGVVTSALGSVVVYVVGPLVGSLGASTVFNYFKAE